METQSYERNEVWKIQTNNVNFNLFSYVEKFSEQELCNADVLINIFSP